MSVKMKVKVVIFAILFSVSNLWAMGIVRHTLISVTERKITGKLFKHVMKSGNAAQDEFFIDGFVVSADQYACDLERAEKKEREIKRCQEEEKRRSQVAFTNTAQSAIIAKIIGKVIDGLQGLVAKIGHHQQLEYYFVFRDATISSIDQFEQLKKLFAGSKNLVIEYIDSNDLEGLQQLYNKLEPWPDRLEKFFQESVQNAIQQSDNTTFLKELLTLIAEDA